MDSRPNRFSAALRDLTERITLTTLSADSGVSAGDLSRFRSGRTRVSRVAFQRIAAALAPADGIPLVLAYLLDERPEDYETLIQIAATGTSISEPSETSLTRWQRALQWVASQEHNPSISDWLIGTAELISGVTTAENAAANGDASQTSP